MTEVLVSLRGTPDEVSNCSVAMTTSDGLRVEVTVPEGEERPLNTWYLKRDYVGLGYYVRFVSEGGTEFAPVGRYTLRFDGGERLPFFVVHGAGEGDLDPEQDPGEKEKSRNYYPGAYPKKILGKILVYIVVLGEGLVLQNFNFGWFAVKKGYFGKNVFFRILNFLGRT